MHWNDLTVWHWIIEYNDSGDTELLAVWKAFPELRALFHDWEEYVASVFLKPHKVYFPLDPEHP